MGNPSQPTNVKLSVLREVLEDLQALQNTIDNPPYDSFDSIRGDLAADLKGMQENVADVAGRKYGSSLFYVDRGWKDVTTGVNTLVTLLNSTITAHGHADNEAAQNATSTNTATTSPGGSGAAGKG